MATVYWLLTAQSIATNPHIFTVLWTSLTLLITSEFSAKVAMVALAADIF
jgi:hypothetical protein